MDGKRLKNKKGNINKKKRKLHLQCKIQNN